MELKLQEIKEILNEKMKKNKLLFISSIFSTCITIIYSLIFDFSLFYMGLSFYFLLLGVFTLPTINRCKSDLNDYKKGDTKEVIGTVIDVFKEIENNEDSKQFIFIKDTNTSKYLEFLCYFKLNEVVQEGVTVKIKYTKKTLLPLSIELINE